MAIKVAIAHVGDSRDDFFAQRRPLLEEESKGLDWLREACEVTESGVLRSTKAVKEFAGQVRQFETQALIIHMAIWADPILSVKLHDFLNLPILLLGNGRPDTSSTVGMLGAGGALDQVGAEHVRVFDHTTRGGRKKALAFLRAAATRQQLRGQTLGLFGGRSLGIFTAGADATQWQRSFGVDIELVDQLEIKQTAEGFPAEVVSEHTEWLLGKLGSVHYGGIFNADGLDRQMRSYLATNALIEKYGFDFVGVKCQRELSDGYASQCVAHMLMNGGLDARGMKRPFIHACESDADGALTMQILHLLSEGRPAALVDLRWLNGQTGIWTLANCGAVAADFFASQEDQSGLSNVHMVPHVFGEGGGGALSGIMPPQKLTLARLCRRHGQYWMAIISGEAQAGDTETLKLTTSAFPQVLVKSSAGQDFLEKFGSNHIHLVSGDFVEEVEAFCQLVGIPYHKWD